MNKEQNKLCTQYMPLAKSIAHKLYRFYVRYNNQLNEVDAEQTAYLGLCKACEKYEPSHNLSFDVFAANWFIKPELIDYFYKNLLSVNFDFRRAISRVKEFLQDKPTEKNLKTIADYAELSEESTEYVLSTIWGNVPHKSLIKAVKDIELIGSKEKTDSTTIKNEVKKGLFNEMERMLTTCECSYVGKKLTGYSNKEISETYSVSESRVSFVIKTAMTKLKKSKLLKELYCG